MRPVRVGDVTLAVADVGDGPAILALHGFTGSSATWAGLPQVLAGRRILSPDLLGHGRSDAPDDPARYALERQAEDLAALVGGLGAAPADVLGYSMGARLALVMALRHPGSVAGLVLESPSAGIADAEERARRREQDEVLARRVEREGVAAFVEAWASQPLFASHAVLPPGTRARLQAERLSHDPRGLAASLRGAGQGAMAPLLEELGRIDRPTLVIAGALDSVGVERAGVVAGAMPCARLAIIPSAGHTPHLEQAEAFHRLVREAFLPSAVPPH